ncbi:hypothetical protein PVK06_039256 [Gossypium arboreum]|uniref:Uncharacterized protein n=1 Tax=Gossypium arboreum TaxID=29729 RepID=A0ABR0N2G3_GOSAR|nr:hypothetical protein PVK06_039256 [Gossypium arboreum]
MIEASTFGNAKLMMMNDVQGYNGDWLHHGMTGSLERHRDDGLSALWSDIATAIIDKYFGATPSKGFI